MLLPIFNTQVAEQIPTATYFPLLSEEQCEQILSGFVKDTGEQARVGGRLDKNKRDAIVRPLPNNEDTAWLYKLVVDRVASYNQFGYDFDVSGLYTDFQLVEYGEGSHYDWHIDIGPGLESFRKLSVIIQLSDPKDYEGGEVVFKAGEEKTLPKTRGQIAVFPSYILHKVSPITKGKRYSLVCWVQGQRRFR